MTNCTNSIVVLVGGQKSTCHLSSCKIATEFSLSQIRTQPQTITARPTHESRSSGKISAKSSGDTNNLNDSPCGLSLKTSGLPCVSYTAQIRKLFCIDGGVYLKTFPSRTGLPSTVVSEHHISVMRTLSSSDTGVATFVQSYLREKVYVTQSWGISLTR